MERILRIPRIQNIKNSVYFLMRWVFSVVSKIFFEEINIIGSVPNNCPVILVSIHRNSLIDGMMMVLCTKRKTSLFVKETLYNSCLFGWIMKMCHTIPVRRRCDNTDSLLLIDNSESIIKSVDILRNNGCIALFPEGISHTYPNIQPLKHGVANIAIQSIDEYCQKVYVVPIGLNYNEKENFRSKCNVFIGHPIEVNSSMSVTILLDQIKNNLIELSTTAPNDETMKTTELISKIIRDYSYDGIKWSTVVDKYLDIKQNYPNLNSNIIEYQMNLSNYHIDDNVVEINFSKHKFLTYHFYLLVAFINILPGILLNLPIILLGLTCPILATKHVLQQSRSRGHFTGDGSDMISTFKVLVLFLGIIFFFAYVITIPICFAMYVHLESNFKIVWLTIWICISIPVLNSMFIMGYSYARQNFRVVKNLYRSFCSISQIDRQKMIESRNYLKNELKKIIMISITLQ